MKQRMHRKAHVVAALWALLLGSGCGTQQKIGMEGLGRPALIWHSTDDAAAESRRIEVERDTEQQLLTELHESEHKGEDNLALAATLYSLAILRRQQGDLPQATQLYRRALAIRERVEGPNHPDVATTLNNLAAAEAVQEHYDAAQPLLERALTIRRAALGSEAVQTAESMNNLALLYAAQGNAAAAEPLYQEALAAMEKSSTSEPDGLRRVLSNYAALLHDTGRNAEADALETRAQALRAIEAPPLSPPQ